MQPKVGATNVEFGPGMTTPLSGAGGGRTANGRGVGRFAPGPAGKDRRPPESLCGHTADAHRQETPLMSKPSAVVLAGFNTLRLLH